MRKFFAPLRRMSLNRLCCCVETEDSLTLPERDPYVGIQEHVGHHPKLTALMKHRASHFHVNEIGLDGKIVHLTDLSPPSQPADLTPDEPFYVHCTLYKEATAHPDLLEYLIRKLKIKSEDIGLAGIKDKWGKTSQRMSVRNVHPQHLVALCSRSRHVKLGNFTYGKHPIAAGDLTGNHFRIMLTNVTSPTDPSSSIAEQIHTAVTSLKDFGFINYYGRQRFGFEQRSQIIGKAMVQMNWEQVFDLVLSHRKYEPNFVKAAKRRWLSGRDPIDIVKNLPLDLGTDKKLKEIWLLQGLAEHYDGGKGDLIQAFKTIPEYMRLLNYAAFKSFLWNHLVSFRIRTFGLKPIPGDMVSLGTDTREGGNISIPNIEPTDSLDHAVKVLTEHDFDSNGNCRDYSIYDVVLDAPGSRMAKYANAQVQSYLEMLLKINQLETDSFAKFVDKFADEVEPVNHARAFRHIVRRPINLTYQIVPYARKDLRYLDRFIRSDLDVLQRREIKSPAETERAMDSICVILEFSLLKGTYATIALREVLNCTSTWK